jgi:predicted transcriptional regulator
MKITLQKLLAILSILAIIISAIYIPMNIRINGLKVDIIELQRISEPMPKIQTEIEYIKRDIADIKLMIKDIVSKMDNLILKGVLN